MTRIVLAYPPGLDGRSADDASDVAGRGAIGWLSEQHGAEVITLTLDFGRGRELEAVRDNALAAGAVRAHVLDVGPAFASRFLLPTLRAGALYANGQEPAGRIATTTGLGRAVIAEKLVEIAGIEQTTVVAHGCGADDRRVAASVRALDPKIRVIAVPVSSNGSDTWMGPRVATQGDPPEEPAYIDITFTRGTPTAINGITMPLVDLLASIDMLAGTHRVGRFHHLETPAVAVLHAAHRALQELVTAPAERDEIAERYVDLIETGRWFSPDREALDGTVDRLENAVSGQVRVELRQGTCRIVDVKAGTRG